MIKGYSICLPDQLIEYINEIANKKQIDENQVMNIFKDSLLSLAKFQYGNNKNIKIHIQDDALLYCWLYRTIITDGVDTDDEITEVSLNKIETKYTQDGVCAELLPGLAFNRENMKIFRSVFFKGILTLEKDRIYHIYKDRVGEIVTGIVKHIDIQTSHVGEKRKYGEIIFDIGCDAYLSFSESIIECDRFKIGDRVKAVILNVQITEDSQYVVFLSRKSNEFLNALMNNIIPEIQDGIIEIKKIARFAGARSKVAVYSDTVDAVGTCIGFKGAKIKLVSAELQYEQIDIVEWSHDIETLIFNCFKNIKINQLILDKEKYTCQIIVNNDDKSNLIGKNGQNVRLVSILLDNYDIKILSNEEYQESLQSNI